MTDAIRDAYSALRKAAPLGAQDCGKLCGACCCKGSGNDGMELFHGEEVRYAADPGFTVRKADGRTLLICTGHCRRQDRPLACRMYPLFPMPVDTPDGTQIRVVYDVRGAASCPMVREQIPADPRFVRAVRKAGLYLLRDPENERILKETAVLFEELVSFAQKIKKEP